MASPNVLRKKFLGGGNAPAPAKKVATKKAAKKVASKKSVAVRRVGVGR